MADDAVIPDAWPPGTQIDRGVVLGRAIGRGSWGIVYEATHPAWKRVAVKEYLPSHYAARASSGLSAKTPRWQEAVRQGLQDFRREAEALRDLQNRHVVRIFDLIEDKDTLFLVMDFLEGPTVEQAAEAGDYDDPAAVMALGETLISTLEAIHAENLLHRDIAPDNIIIAKGRPVLFDFGAAGAAVSAVVRSSRGIVKDGYSPPEQYDGGGEAGFSIGPWSDIYATAAVLHRLASKTEPPSSQSRLNAVSFGGRSDPLRALSDLEPAGFPKSWLAAVDLGLQLDPRRRPQTAAEWAEAFGGPAPRREGAPRAASGGTRPDPPPERPRASATPHEPQPEPAREKPILRKVQVKPAPWPLVAVLGIVAAGALVLADMHLANGIKAADEAMKKGDWAKGAALYQRAADKGDTEAQRKLAQLYDEGSGVPKDPAKAMVLLRSATDAGDAEAGKILATHVAQAFVGEWTPRGLSCRDAAMTIQLDADELVTTDGSGGEERKTLVTAKDGLVTVKRDATTDTYVLDGDNLVINGESPDRKLTLSPCGSK